MRRDARPAAKRCIGERRRGSALRASGIAAALALLAAPLAQAARPAAAGAAAQAGVLAPPVTAPLEVRQMLGVRTPMRDGVALVSDIYLPSAPGRYPAVLMRTPYLRTQEFNDGPAILAFAHRLAREGIVFVHQDVRGRGDSGGEHHFFFGEGPDGYDTIEWIAHQPWSNGQVAMIGGSYRGSVQWFAAREHPPHLTCLLSQSPGAAWFDAVPYYGGALQMDWTLTYLNMTADRLTENGPAALTEWNKVFRHRPLIDQDVLLGRILTERREMLAHPTIDDFWRPLILSPADYGAIDVPALHITGWYDGELPGTMEYWHGMAHSPARARQYLLIGPWLHSGTRSGGSTKIGALDLGAQSVVDVDSLALDWFRSCFAGTTDRFDFPRARVFMTGVNQWRDLAAYPDPAAANRSFYLHSQGDARASDGGNGRLSERAPGAEPPDHYVFDPLAMLPPDGAAAHRRNGDVQGVAIGVPHRDDPPRADELRYASNPFAKPLAVLGPVSLKLWIASSAPDTDFVGILYDVGPDGRALPVVTKMAVLRARYRLGYDRQVPLVPGRPTGLELHFFDVGHVFQPGHRLRIDVSSYAPGTNPNQNTGHDVATDTEWRSAAQTVLHDRRHPSRLELPVIPWP